MRNNSTFNEIHMLTKCWEFIKNSIFKINENTHTNYYGKNKRKYLGFKSNESVFNCHELLAEVLFQEIDSQTITKTMRSIV